MCSLLCWHHSGIVQVGESDDVSFRQQAATPMSKVGSQACEQSRLGKVGSRACLAHTLGCLLPNRNIIGLTDLYMCMAKIGQSVKPTGLIRRI